MKANLLIGLVISLLIENCIIGLDFPAFRTRNETQNGKQESAGLGVLTLAQLEVDVVLIAVGRRPYFQGISLEKIGIEVGSLHATPPAYRHRQFNTIMPNIKCINNVTFEPDARTQGGGGNPTAVYIRSGHGRNGKTEQELKQAGVKFEVSSFLFYAN